MRKGCLIKYIFMVSTENFIIYISDKAVMSTSITSSTLGKKTYKIIFLGDSGTGKTSII